MSGMTSVRKGVPLWCLFFVGLFFPVLVYSAPEIEEAVPLNFGTFAITGNNSVSTFTYPRTGRNFSIAGNLVLIAEGTPGRFLLSGFPPNVTIDVEADDTTLTAGGTGIPEPLSVSNYDFSDLFSNDSGEVELQMGGTFSTSGNTGDYEDAPYSGGTQLRFHYWEPQVSDYVTVTKNITLAAEVRSGFQLEEAQSLSFGSLFARATPGDQASLTLFPGGGFELVNSGDARLVSLTDPRPAVLVVQGAAPNRQLSVVLQAGNVLLENKSVTTAPHFILSDLTSSADNGSDRTDSEGTLEIRVGGKLTTEQTPGTVVYPSGTYEGVYSITIEY